MILSFDHNDDVSCNTLSTNVKFFDIIYLGVNKIEDVVNNQSFMTCIGNRLLGQECIFIPIELYIYENRCLKITLLAVKIDLFI